jgi:hypothetical protein
MAVDRGRGTKNRSVFHPYLGGRCKIVAGDYPQKEILNMLSTVPAAVVEPKEKSQNPGAKAKRLKGLRVNPDFAEAVSEERAAARMWIGRCADLHRKYKVMMDERLSSQREVIDNEELKKEYIAQLKENKELCRPDPGVQQGDSCFGEKGRRALIIYY